MRFQNLINESANFTTMMQESLHCVSFGVAQLKKTKVNVDILMNSNNFTKSYREYCKVNVASDQTLYDWAKDNMGWVESIVLNTNVWIASPFYKKRYTYYRGVGLMNDIYEQYGRLSSAEGIKLHPDKWNPGDVWAFASGVNVKHFDSLGEFNTWISQELIKGNIVPISLKKSAGSPKVVYINQGDKSAVKSYKYKGVAKPQKAFNTGVSIKTSDPALTLNVRSFSIASEAPPVAEIQLKGTGARHGKAPIAGYIKKYHIFHSYKGVVVKHLQDGDFLKQAIIRNWKDLGHTWSDKQIEAQWSKLNPQYRDGSQAVGYYLSILNSQEFALFLEKNKAYADIIVNDIVKIGSSHSDYSSDFIKIF